VPLSFCSGTLMLIVGAWWQQKLGEVFTDAAFSDGSLHATLKAPEKITGDASICVVRGKKRYLFDFAFKLPFQVAVSGGGNYKGSYTMDEISNDEDYEVSIVSCGGEGALAVVGASDS